MKTAKTKSTPKEIRQVITTSHLFRGLRPDLIEEIASSATWKTVGADEILFQKGDPADALWGVLSGHIVIEVGTDDGKEMVLDSFSKGEVFGEVGVLDFGPRRVGARATQQSELFRLGRQHFLKHLQTSPELCFRVFSLLCSHLRETTENLEDTALHKLPGRLAKRLTLLAADSGTGDGTILHIVQSDLASMLGVHRQAVNRHLREFEKDGMIALKRQSIEIVDPEALADLATPGQTGHHADWGTENLATLERRASTFSQHYEGTSTTQERQLAGLMAIDLAEYSRALMTDAAGTVKRIEAGLNAIDRAIEKHQGHTVWHTGDRVLAEFPEARLAMQAALAIQEQVNTARRADRGKWDSLFRMGVHHGVVLVGDHRFFGEAVNTAIRLTQFSGAGGIAISGAVRDSLENREQLELQFLGDHELKNVPGTVRVYSVRAVPIFKMLALRAETLIPRRFRLVLAMVAVALAGASIWLAGERFGVSNAPGRPNQSIAVMSFTHEGDPENFYLADGLAEEIRTALAAMPEALVIGRQSSDYFEGWNATGQEIGEILRVSYVLHGTIGLTGEQLNVSSRLIETKNGTEVWHNNYQGSWQDFMGFQTEIVRLTNETLAGGGAVDSQPSSAVLSVTENQGAYTLYLQARELINEKTRASLVEALGKLDRALESEADFASAHVAMAEAYVYLAYYTDYYEDPTKRNFDYFARPHVEQALAIDPNLAEAHVMRGILSEDGNVSEAESAFRTAISLNPNHSRAHLWLGIALANDDQLRSWNEHMPHIEKALEIEPLSVEAATILLEFLMWFPQRREEAWTIINKLKQHYPDHVDVNLTEASWLVHEGRPSAAVPILERVIANDKNNARALKLSNIVWFSLGETERALQASAWAEQYRFVLSPHREESLKQMKAPDKVAIPGLSAYVFVMLHDWQSAVDALVGFTGDMVAFEKEYAPVVAKRYSPAMSLAVAYAALGDVERSTIFAKFEKKALMIKSENGKIQNSEYLAASARLYALDGRIYEAMDELERLITTGPIDPRELMHPAFDEMRDDPGFKRLKNLQRQRMNSEREKLELAPLSAGLVVPGRDTILNN